MPLDLAVTGAVWTGCVGLDSPAVWGYLKVLMHCLPIIRWKLPATITAVMEGTAGRWLPFNKAGSSIARLDPATLYGK